MSGKLRNAETIIYLLISVLLVFIFKKAASSPLSESGIVFGFNYNLVVYVLSLLGMFVLFLILMLLTDRLSRTLFWADLPDPEVPGKGGIAKRILFIIYIAAAICVLIFIYQIYINENNLYPQNNAATFIRQEVPHPVYFSVIAVLAAVLYFSFRAKQHLPENIVLRFGLYAPVCFLQRHARLLPEHPEGQRGGSPAYPRRDEFYRQRDARRAL